MNTQIYQALPGRPFGVGSDGSVTLSSDPHTRRTATGTSGTKTLTLNSSAYSNGDLILIHQTRNTSSATEENWEVNSIVSGGGTTSLTLLNNLGRTYTSGTQVLDIKQYINLTIGSFTPTAWNGSTGGILAIAALGLVTWSGTVTYKGGNASGASAGTGGGFRGGNSGGTDNGFKGEGYTGTWNVDRGNTPNGNGAGGGTIDAGPGGGGGNSVAGSTAATGGASGGLLVGNTDLTSLFLGGGGGGGKRSSGEGAGAGGAGGGAMILWGNNITVTGSANFKGGNGSDGHSVADGGGGAGGSLQINGQIVSLGSNLINATKGLQAGSGGAGADGRIKVNFGAKHSGTTSPSYNYANNIFLNPQQGGGMIAMM